MNLKIRFKNPVFIAQILLSILIPVFGYYGLQFQDMNSWPILGDTLLKAISNPYVLAMAVISIWNALNDPTTKGVADSHRAMCYTELGGGNHDGDQ